jgi:endonuclease/exonuclease/phosphatase family metal-dependent hydrolase
MGTVKLTSWNVEHLDTLLTSTNTRRKDAVVQEIRQLSPDILCVLEGPKGAAAIESVAANLLNGDWIPVMAADGEYDTQGSQWIWFLVKKELYAQAAFSLLPPTTWKAFTGFPTWQVNYWGDFTQSKHSHYRHPQVLVMEKNGFRAEFIGLHLKSKFVNQGESMWNAGGEQRNNYIRESLKARVKMSTEAFDVRRYIAKKFEQVETPAIFVLGDLNDGPGKDYFEDKFLFFDLLSNIQGDIFQASQFLNHALFDFPDNLRWSVFFKDFVDPARDPRILLDHILFTQGLVNGSLPWTIHGGAGRVEHELHDLINATLPNSSKTSDHKPVSVNITVSD